MGILHSHGLKPRLSENTLDFRVVLPLSILVPTLTESNDFPVIAENPIDKRAGVFYSLAWLPFAMRRANNRTLSKRNENDLQARRRVI
jgi:hypothetical protein